MRDLHGHAVLAARDRFNAQDCTTHGHTRGRHLSSRSGREPDNNEKLRSPLNLLRQPDVQAASTKTIEVGIGLKRFAIHIHATHGRRKRRLHAGFSSPLYPTVKACKDVIALRMVAPYFPFINCLSPTSSKTPLAGYLPGAWRVLAGV